MKNISQAMELPTGYPRQWQESVRLEDGTPVTIRPILPADAPRLQIGFKHLSPETIYMRFRESFTELSEKQAHYYANVDYVTRMAFVAAALVEGNEMVIGVARYDLLGPEHPGAAECAVIVGDEFQGFGLGTLLMTRLIGYAVEHEVHTFVGTVQIANTRIISFIKSGGLDYKRQLIEPGMWEVKVSLV